MSENTNLLWAQVYDELRKLAKARLRNEKSCLTLQPTAIVHEVYVKLQVNGQDLDWKSRLAFFKAAAEAMRRVLVDHARRKNAIKRGEGTPHYQVEPSELAELAIDLTHIESTELIQLDEGLSLLAESEPMAAKVVELRFFGGLKQFEVAESLGISTRKCDRLWAFARAWLYRHFTNEEEND